MAEEGIKNGVYKHFKGKFYQVLGTARHSETLEEFVVYKALHETEFGPDEWFIRPRDLFLGKAVVEEEGERILVPRFEYLENGEL